MAKNHWKDRLRLQHWKGSVYTKDTVIEDDPDKMFEFADKYLAADKNYEVKL